MDMIEIRSNKDPPPQSLSRNVAVEFPMPALRPSAVRRYSRFRRSTVPTAGPRGSFRRRTAPSKVFCQQPPCLSLLFLFLSPSLCRPFQILQCLSVSRTPVWFGWEGVGKVAAAAAAVAAIAVCWGTGTEVGRRFESCGLFFLVCIFFFFGWGWGGPSFGCFLFCPLFGIFVLVWCSSQVCVLRNGLVDQSRLQPWRRRCWNAGGHRIAWYMVSMNGTGVDGQDCV